MTMYAEYDFTVNQDFTTVSKNLENGGRSIDYYITLDMAKHKPFQMRLSNRRKN